MQYLPFLNGKYSTAPGLTAMDKAVHQEDKLIFQIDAYYQHYIHNKRACRKENIHKYYCEEEFLPETILNINYFIVNRLLQEYPSVFSLQEDGHHYTLINHHSNEQLCWNKDWVHVEGENYISLFDALCCQVQEDLAVCQLSDDKDWMSAIHLCAPNHWSAADKVGKSFDAVHAPVPGMEKTLDNYYRMLQAVVQKGPFTRFAWGISTDDRLNHHPVPPPGANAEEWYGRKPGDTEKIFIRTERQNLIGFPDANAFLFTIRTYFYDISSLSYADKNALFDAVAGMSPASLAYKGLTGRLGKLKKLLLTDMDMNR
ncbi:MAG TPA: DUF3445 domain-containing protein [Puia sp.]|nr:DUF3445 domain-containing protein [Puia sp.]